MPGYQDILGDFQNAMAQAKAANQARYDQGLGVLNNRIAGYQAGAKQIASGYDSLLARQAKVGDSQRADVQANYVRNLGQAQSNLFSRGLGNSSLLAGATRGANYDQSRSMLDLNDNLASQYRNVALAKLGYRAQAQQGVAGLQGDYAKFIQDRTDAYPDLGAYANLARMAGMGMAGAPSMGGGATIGGFGAGSRGNQAPMPGSYMTTADPVGASIYGLGTQRYPDVPVPQSLSFGGGGGGKSYEDFWQQMFPTSPVSPWEGQGDWGGSVGYNLG